jgi:PPOX class probable F420-dependent enzyme
MSEAELEEFLAAERTLIVATLGPSGHPHVTPMWFALLDGTIVCWPYAASQKIVNLGRDARMSVLVESGDRYDELRGVFMEGTGEIVTDPAAVGWVGIAVATRNGLLGPGVTPADLAARGAKRVALTFRPSRVVSWDHRKLAD